MKLSVISCEIMTLSRFRENHDSDLTCYWLELFIRDDKQCDKVPKAGSDSGGISSHDGSKNDTDSDYNT